MSKNITIGNEVFDLLFPGINCDEDFQYFDRNLVDEKLRDKILDSFSGFVAANGYIAKGENSITVFNTLKDTKACFEIGFDKFSGLLSSYIYVTDVSTGGTVALLINSKSDKALIKGFIELLCTFMKNGISKNIKDCIIISNASNAKLDFISKTIERVSVKKLLLLSMFLPDRIAMRLSTSVKPLV